MSHGDDLPIQHTHQATLDYFGTLAPISIRIAFKSIEWRLWHTVSDGPLDDYAPHIQGEKPLDVYVAITNVFTFLIETTR